MSDYVTAGYPGTGGRIKEDPDDFFVEEVPLYLPCGEGEHLYLLVEKRGVTTLDLLRRLGRAAGIPEREIGYAGLKDARAITRQTISIPAQAAGKLPTELPGVTILETRRHRNKLRPGHLAGNRFRIRIRDVAEGALPAAEQSLQRLQSQGVPNFFGPQRYGALGNSRAVGRAILCQEFAAAAALIVGDPAAIRDDRWRQGAERFRAGDLGGALSTLPGHCRTERALIGALHAGRSPRQAVLALPRPLLRLYLSACQSALFDHIIRQRLHDLGRLWEGDLACRHDNGACFKVEDPSVEQPRADRLEISPSGPLFGFKVLLAQGEAGRLETELLAAEALRLEDFRLAGGLAMEGERRPLRVPLGEPSVCREGNDLLLAFFLPKGSYATSVLREIMKTDAALSL
jgi:tRNA pseudouridine13 synthase